MLATIDEMLIIYDGIFDPSMPSSVVSGLRELVAARRDYPALCATGPRHRLPTSNDNLYYAFLRTTPVGNQEMMAVFNFQAECRVLQVYIDKAADLIDIATKDRQHVDDVLQLWLPPFRYKIYEVVR